MIFFLHIPRVGGKSVVKWLRQLIPSQEEIYTFSNYARFSDGFHGSHGKLRNSAQFKIIAGHFAYGLDRYFPECRAGYLIVLREPIERVKSLIRYISKNKKHRLHELFAKADNIDDFYNLIQHSPQISNGQVRQLCGIADLASPMDSAHYDVAASRIAGDNALVFLTEELSDYLRPVKAAGIKGIPRTNDTKTNVISWLDSEVADAVIRKNNELDIRLYDFAKKHRCHDASAMLPYLI